MITGEVREVQPNRFEQIELFEDPELEELLRRADASPWFADPQLGPLKDFLNASAEYRGLHNRINR